MKRATISAARSIALSSICATACNNAPRPDGDPKRRLGTFEGGTRRGTTGRAGCSGRGSTSLPIIGFLIHSDLNWRAESAFSRLSAVSKTCRARLMAGIIRSRIDVAY